MTKFLNPKCAKCGHYQMGQCLLTGETPNDTALCYNYTESPYICELCGKHLTNELVNYVFGNQTLHHLVCINCLQKMYSCETCECGNTCKFEQDHTVPEPTYVMQQIRQGPAVIQQQVKNPKRINLTCRVNCPCFINEQCCKEIGSCDKYQCSVENW